MPKRQPNKQYNVAKPDGLPVRIAGYQRRYMYDRFLKETEIVKQQTLLDVGVTSDRSYASSNYLEAWYPHKSLITAIGIDDASFLREIYPGVSFSEGADFRYLFEIHLSTLSTRPQFSSMWAASKIKSCLSANVVESRKAVFMTTPNRWFPVEFHTILPLVHWLPKRTFRKLMHKIGRSFFAEERNLNLLDARALRSIANRIAGYDFHISSVSLCGWPSNLLLIGRRTCAVSERSNETAISGRWVRSPSPNANDRSLTEPQGHE